MKFEEFKLHEQLLEGLGYMGFEDATPIQEAAIPKILSGKDLIGCAQTGTGKTAAFILPVLHKLASKKAKGLNTLVICPTRELAIQIEQEIQGFAYFTGATSLAIYGGGDGTNWEAQKLALTDGCDIVVATPGKLLSHINMGYVDFSNIEHIILDEADRMLDMGFVDDILKIIEMMPKDRQSLFFSATMPSKIRDFAAKILKKEYDQISMAISKPAEGVLQAAYLVYDNQKARLLTQLIDKNPEYESIIVFTSTKRKVADIMQAFRGKKYTVAAISSDYEQKQREEVLLGFRSKRVRVLIATDVVSRGIDIKDINLVVNYDVPNDAPDYVHRVGRTARANTTGVALTLVNEDDMYKMHKIEELIESEVPKSPLPPELGEGPKWDTSFRKKKSFKRPFNKNKRNFKKR
ncbi:MAG: DEAD/DEAH box helicase [Flavobacteriales bacterium]|nr:DEAD/DEAH box helicase [Flavobacteriales bacterium]